MFDEGNGFVTHEMKTYSIVAERIAPDRQFVDCRRPPKLYRYSQAKWLEGSLKFGEFRLRPAADYKDLITDAARNDDELVRVQSTDGQHVKIEILRTGQEITPIGPVTYRSEVGTNYLVSCFSTAWDSHLFEEFPDTDACLVIHQTEEFCERLHAAADVQLAGWVGIDGAVSYGGRSPLGAVFSKPLQFLRQNEWRFAWIPPKPRQVMETKILKIGNIEAIAEVRMKP